MSHTVIYRAGRDNANADAFSRQPYLPVPAVGTADGEVQVLSIEASELDISSLIEVEPDSITSVYNPQKFFQEQKKDDEVLAMIQYLQDKTLPEATTDAHQIAVQAPMFAMVDQTLYYLDDKQPGIKRIVVPKHLRMQIMQIWQVIFLECDCIGLWQGDGGGMECTVML